MGHWAVSLLLTGVATDKLSSGKRVPSLKAEWADLNMYVELIYLSPPQIVHVPTPPLLCVGQWDDLKTTW